MAKAGEKHGALRVVLWIFYDLIYITLAAGIYGLGVLAAGALLRAAHHLAGWTGVAFAALPAYMLGLLVVVLVLGAIRLASPRLEPGIYRKFSKGQFFSLVWLTGLNNVVFAMPFMRTINFIAVFRYLYYRGQGMQTHFNNWISVDAVIMDPTLVRLGKGVNIGGMVGITCHLATQDHMMILPVTIGDGVLVGAATKIAPGVEIGAGALIGANSGLGVSVKIGEGAYLEPGSWVESNTVIGPYEKWAGWPAVKVGQRPRPKGAAPAPASEAESASRTVPAEEPAPSEP